MLGIPMGIEVPISWEWEWEWEGTVLCKFPIPMLRQLHSHCHLTTPQVCAC